MSKPGVMLYWPTFDVLEKMASGDAKTMLSAIRKYAQYGEMPEFEEYSALDIMWPIIRDAIDKDEARYAAGILQKKYAVYVREAEKHGIEPESYEEWKEHRPISPDNG